MGSWGNNDNAANSAFFAPAQVNVTANTQNQTNLYGNTTPGAFVEGQAVGQFGASVNEVQSSVNEGRIAKTPGWHLRRQGTGSIVNIVIAAAGTGYANTDTVAFTSPSGDNAAGAITTDGSGVITSVAITDPGAGYLVANTTGTITTSGGSGGTLTGVAGGKVGRVTYETLVAMNDLTGDGSDDTQLPD